MCFGDPLLNAETFKMDRDGLLAEIGRNPMSVEEVEGQYMGLLRLTPRAWQELESIRSDMESAERDKLDMTSALQLVLDRKQIAIHPIPYHGTWGEIDSAEDLAVYQQSGS